MSARAWIAIAAASLGWGTAGVATRAALEEGVDPYAIATLRSVMAGLAIGAYLLWRKNRRRPSREAWGVGAVMGVTNLALPFVLFTLAYQYASAGFVGLLAALIPLGTAIWAHFLLDDEPFHGRTLAAMTIALAGVALLVLIGDSGIGSEGQPVTAFTLGLAAVVSAAFGGVWAKRHKSVYQPIELVGMQFATGGVLLIATMLIAEGAPTGIGLVGWLLLAYMAAFGSFMPFLLFYWLLQHVSATRASLVGYVVPLVALVTGILVLDERLELGIVVGGALILVGVVLTDRTQRRLVRA